jgi:hypothetical protein
MPTSIIHPRDPEFQRVDRDFVFLMASYDIDLGSFLPKVTTMTEFNLWCWNTRVFPGIDPAHLTRINVNAAGPAYSLVRLAKIKPATPTERPGHDRLAPLRFGSPFVESPIAPSTLLLGLAAATLASSAADSVSKASPATRPNVPSVHQFLTSMATPNRSRSP